MLDLTEEAWQVWEQLYAELSEGEDDLLGAVIARAEAHVRRLAVVYALLDESEHRRGRPPAGGARCLGLLRRQRRAHLRRQVGYPRADKILSAIRDAGEDGLSRTDIRSVVGGKSPAEEIDADLRYLDVRGLAHEQVVETAGRPAHTWHAGTVEQSAWAVRRKGVRPRPLLQPPRHFPPPFRRAARRMKLGLPRRQRRPRAARTRLRQPPRKAGPELPLLPEARGGRRAEGGDRVGRGGPVSFHADRDQVARWLDQLESSARSPGP